MLGSQGITAAGAQTICGVLAENGRLLSLVLASNPLGDDGEAWGQAT